VPGVRIGAVDHDDVAKQVTLWNLEELVEARSVYGAYQVYVQCVIDDNTTMFKARFRVLPPRFRIAQGIQELRFAGTIWPGHKGVQGGHGQTSA
jgi:hypothetical protein